VTSPNFEQLTMKELRSHVLQHRNNQDAIHALGQRIHKEGRKATVEELVTRLEEKRQQGIEP
jgi:hypothetical protein